MSLCWRVWRRRRRRRRRKVYSEEEEEEEEEEGLFRANAVNEEDPGRDRATPEENQPRLSATD